MVIGHQSSSNCSRMRRAQPPTANRQLPTINDVENHTLSCHHGIESSTGKKIDICIGTKMK